MSLFVSSRCIQPSASDINSLCFQFSCFNFKDLQGLQPLLVIFHPSSLLGKPFKISQNLNSIFWILKGWDPQFSLNPRVPRDPLLLEPPLWKRVIYGIWSSQHVSSQCYAWLVVASLDATPRKGADFANPPRPVLTWEKFGIVKIPSWELTYPPPKALLKMLLFQRWDMLGPWRVPLNWNIPPCFQDQ